MAAFFIVVYLLLSLPSGLPQHADVSLSSGWHGRVEVLYAGILGSVCDDDWDNNDCAVVCRQIGYSGGLAVREAALLYGEGTGRIWLDDVNCSGTENYLDDCEHDFWGTHNCLHKEDAGCTCNQPANVQSPGGACDQSLHRLVEFDAVQYPGVGRVEVRTSVTGPWYGVCDDKWDDIGAQVFCNCAGYTDLVSSHAYWSPSLSTLPSVPILYDSVHCDMSHISVLGNLHQCEVQPASGKCNSDEAAGVACQPIPHNNPPEPPSVSLTCDGRQMNVCFSSASYTLETRYLASHPSCLKATTSSISQGVCMEIDMEVCDTSSQQSDASSKHYCYNISYTQYDSDPATLLIDQVWMRRACCQISKNDTVSSSFEPLVADHPSVLAEAPTSFSLDCFSEETFSGAPLVFPAQVARGQDVYCRVSADTWDPNMYLVVPHCSFQATPSGIPAFQFHSNKCPTSAALGVSYYSFDGHRWGFRFPMPKFQGYADVYVVCSTYVCDIELDSKPYCDRSCYNVRRRRRQAVHTDTPITSGPFHVTNGVCGPFISSNGTLTVTDSGIKNSLSRKHQSVEHQSFTYQSEQDQALNGHSLEHPEVRQSAQNQSHLLSQSTGNQSKWGQSTEHQSSNKLQQQQKLGEQGSEDSHLETHNVDLSRQHAVQQSGAPLTFSSSWPITAITVYLACVL